VYKFKYGFIMIWLSYFISYLPYHSLTSLSQTWLFIRSKTQVFFNLLRELMSRYI